VPFGPPAALLAQKIGLKVVIINGAKLANLNNILLGKKVSGTVVS
jgi:isopentenyl phosphate kinase